MAAYSNYALRIPSSLMSDIRLAADGDGVSMNSFIIQAIAEKVTRLRERGLLRDMNPEEQAAYFEGRAARGAGGSLAESLRQAGTTDRVLPGDELPEDWLDRSPPDSNTAPAGPQKSRGA